jgi:hypothetical protein
MRGTCCPQLVRLNLLCGAVQGVQPSRGLSSWVLGCCSRLHTTFMLIVDEGQQCCPHKESQRQNKTSLCLSRWPLCVQLCRTEDYLCVRAGLEVDDG